MSPPQPSSLESAPPGVSLKPITVGLKDNSQGRFEIRSKQATTQITFNQGVTTVPFTIQATDDNKPNQQEQYQIDIVIPKATPALAETKLQVTLLAHDTPTLSITPITLTLNEGQTTQLTITANTTVTENITITLDDNSQYQITIIPSTIILKANTASTVFSITVPEDDTPEEETDYTITLSGLTGFAQIGTTNTATITIPANDINLDQPVITATLNTNQLKEGQATTLTITATQITKPTTLSFKVVGPLDLPKPTTFTENGMIDITITATNDNIPSLSQLATLTLSVDTNTQLFNNQFTFTITPDLNDQYQIGFEQDQITLSEGSTQAITVIRNIPPTLSTPTTVTVNLNNPNPGQITLATTQVTFNPQTITQTITLFSHR